jgi:AraC-like DNA-binding protein
MLAASAFRQGSALGCGFSCREKAEMKGPWGARNIVDRCYILVWLLQGRGAYRDANGNSCVLGPGSLYQRFPGVRHENVFDGETAFQEAYLVMPPQIGELFLESGAASLRRPCLMLGLRPELFARFDALREELLTQPERRLPLTLAALHGFAAELLELASPEKAPDKFSEDACALLEERLPEKLSLPSVARKLGVSYSKFRQLFRLRCGLGPGEYRLKRRLELAQRLLASGDAAIKEVAKACGYPDVYSFSKQFKRQAGLSPGQFLKARRRGL